MQTELDFQLDHYDIVYYCSLRAELNLSGKSCVRMRLPTNPYKAGVDSETFLVQHWQIGEGEASDLRFPSFSPAGVLSYFSPFHNSLLKNVFQG